MYVTFINNKNHGAPCHEPRGAVEKNKAFNKEAKRRTSAPARIKKYARALFFLSPS
jgi:hypothetical protein